MKVLLLGATGLLGHNVLSLLIERKFDVVALVRSRKAVKISPLPSCVQVVEGSLLNRTSLVSAASGCDAIINCTGTTDMSLLRYEDFLPINRDAVALILETMKVLGINCLVQVSTANTIGYGTTESFATESCPMQEPFASSFYAQSKCEGERLVLDAAHTFPEGCRLVVINPGFMVGPWDVKPSSGKLLLAAYRLPVMFAPKGGKSFVDVRAVAMAVVNALFSGENGQRYLVTGENLSLKDFYAEQAECCGYRQRILELPDWLVRVAGKMGDTLRFMGIKTSLSSRNVEQLLVREYYDATYACEVLSLPSFPIRGAIEDFFQWYGK